MKEFVSDLLYMCSSSNSSSRMFYILVTAILALLTLAIPVEFIILIVKIVQHVFQIKFLIFLLVSIAIYIGVIIWLKKS